MFNLAAVALSWIVLVTFMGQPVQQSEPMTQEECIELRDALKTHILIKSRGMGVVGFRGHNVKVSDINVECIEKE